MRWIVFSLAVLAAVPALADDESALVIADSTPTTSRRTRDWRAFFDAMLETSDLGNGEIRRSQRLSFDLFYSGAIAPGWQATFADRVDATWHDSTGDSVNTLKEVFLNWRPYPNLLFDGGRVNVHYGVALGYNPTDFFRRGAVRSVVSPAPASLRENRLGTVMLRAQYLWDEGAVNAIVAPKLADQPSDRSFSADWGATNSKHRWMVAVSKRLPGNLNPQFLIFGEEQSKPQFGLNLSALLNNATVAYVEWSGGRQSSLASEALDVADDVAFRSRLAYGLTYTTRHKLSITLEHEYNGSGLAQSEEVALRTGAPDRYLQYLQFAFSVQDLPTKEAAYGMVSWQDVLIPRFNLSFVARRDLVGDGRLSWSEASYRWNRVDLALRYQRDRGVIGAESGLGQVRQAWQLGANYFF